VKLTPQILFWHEDLSSVALHIPLCESRSGCRTLAVPVAPSAKVIWLRLRRAKACRRRLMEVLVRA